MNGIDRIVTAILAGLLDSLWLALALVAVAWCVSRLLPRTNAATRHLLWWSVLVLMMILPFRGLDRSVERIPAPAIVRKASSVAVSMLPRMVTPSRPAARAGLLPIRIHGGDWSRILVCVWVAFGLFHAGRIAWSFLYLLGIKRRSHHAPPGLAHTFQCWVTACGIRRPVRLMVSSEIATPMATGFLRPAVVLPEALLHQFREQELDHVLLHELAHVARRDDWTNLIARALTALVGLHPVAAWVLRQVARERELACDDWVVSMTGEARPYAASLARLFELCDRRRRMVLATGMAGSTSQLGQRIETLLAGGRQFTPRASLLRVAVAALALLMLAGVGLNAPRWVVLAQSASKFTGPVYQPVKSGPPRASFLAALVAAGYGNLSVDEIISLKSHGVTAAYMKGIADSGWGRMGAEDINNLVTHGVSTEYLYQAHSAGFQELGIVDVVNLHAHGVRPEAIGEIHALGFGPYSPVEAIELTTRGVPPSLFRALRDAGFTQAPAGEVINAYTRGVRPGTLREALQYGSNLTLPQIVKLKQAGVLP